MAYTLIYLLVQEARRFHMRHGFTLLGSIIFTAGDMPFEGLSYARDI